MKTSPALYKVIQHFFRLLRPGRGYRFRASMYGEAMLIGPTFERSGYSYRLGLHEF